MPASWLKPGLCTARPFTIGYNIANSLARIRRVVGPVTGTLAFFNQNDEVLSLLSSMPELSAPRGP
jgi:hypothetical protein